MDADTTPSVVRRRCTLLQRVHDFRGKPRFGERPMVMSPPIQNLGRKMFRVQFDDGAWAFVFSHEILIDTE